MKSTKLMYDQESYELDNIYNEVEDRGARSMPSIWYT
jgi:hypothetical protein